MSNRIQENYLVQVLDERIRQVVEDVLSKMLTEQSQWPRRRAVEAHSNGNHLNHKRRPEQTKSGRRGRRVEISGKVLKTVSTPRGSIVYTEGQKYLRQRDGSVVKVSNVKGSLDPARAMGYSSSQYQLARRYHWPLPCPVDFELPARNKRGRRPKNASS
jgi:hypothetical protein